MIILPLAWVFAFIGTFNSSEWLSKGVFLRQFAFFVLLHLSNSQTKHDLNKYDFFCFCQTGFVCQTYKETQRLKYKTADAL